MLRPSANHGTPRLSNDGDDDDDDDDDDVTKMLLFKRIHTNLILITIAL